MEDNTVLTGSQWLLKYLSQVNRSKHATMIFYLEDIHHFVTVLVTCKEKHLGAATEAKQEVYILDSLSD